MILQKEKVKELRKELKILGYKLKTETAHFNINKCLANIYLNDVFIYGSFANVYPKKIFEEHKKAIDIFNKYNEVDKLKEQKRQDIINKISWVETSSAYGPIERSKRRKELNAQLKNIDKVEE